MTADDAEGDDARPEARAARCGSPSTNDARDRPDHQRADGQGRRARASSSSWSAPPRRTSTCSRSVAGFDSKIFRRYLSAYGRGSRRVKAPLFVRLPTAAVEKLDRAAEALGMRKKDLVAGLVSRYVDPTARAASTRSGSLSTREITLELVEPASTRGSYSFQPYDPPEVMTAAQAAAVPPDRGGGVIEMAAAGKLPGRRLGAGWRFSRAALVAWLSTPETRARSRYRTRYPRDPGADRRRADPPRRARLGPVLAPAQGPHRVPGQRDRRRRRERHHRAAAVPRVGGSGQGRHDVRQLAGRRVSAGLAIYDTMQSLRCPVATFCMGQAASMASLLLAAGAKGKRNALPHARVMIHQPLAGMRGQATDIAIHAREILKARDTINEIYAPHRPARRQDQARHRARQLHVGRGGAGLRPRRPGPLRRRAEVAARSARGGGASGARPTAQKKVECRLLWSIPALNTSAVAADSPSETAPCGK